MTDDFDSIFDNLEKEQTKKTDKKKKKKKNQTAVLEESIIDDMVEEKEEQVVDTTTPKAKDKKKKRKKTIFDPNSDFELPPEEDDSDAEIYMIVGHKGVGKTSLALSFPGTIFAVSFDKKTKRIKKKMFNSDPRIYVYNATRHYSTDDPALILSTSKQSISELSELLEKLADNKKFDWVLIDNLEIYITMAEMTMRYDNDLTPYQGINKLLWKQRRHIIANLHRKAIDASNKGVIYTTYPRSVEIRGDDGITVNEDRPRWIDVVESETDTVIYKVLRKDKNGNPLHSAIVHSSKVRFKEGSCLVDGNDGFAKLTKHLGSNK